MRVGFFIVLIAAALGLTQPGSAAESSTAAYKGIWVSTPFPSFTSGANQSVTLDLKVHNAGMPPQPITLDVEKQPAGWTTAFFGDGKGVKSVFVAPNDSASVKLRLEPPAETANGTYHFVVSAVGKEGGKDAHFSLPIDLTIGASLPPRLTLAADLPDLRGSPSSDFDFKLKLKNDGGSNATVRMDAKTPAGFQSKFTEEYGSQELTSFPLKAGEEKTISAKITPPDSASGGNYPIIVQATTGKVSTTTKLTMEVTGKPDLSVTGVGDRLSSDAEAGKQSTLDVVLNNSGTAPVHNLKLSASPPSGWKIAFEPKSLDLLMPNKTQTVKAEITPSDKAIAGDYMVTVNANGDGVSKSSDFRITVRTSTMWGIVGVLVIAAAMIVLVLAVVRFGRR